MCHSVAGSVFYGDIPVFDPDLPAGAGRHSAGLHGGHLLLRHAEMGETHACQGEGRSPLGQRKAPVFTIMHVKSHLKSSELNMSVSS